MTSNGTRTIVDWISRVEPVFKNTSQMGARGAELFCKQRDLPDIKGF
jgi:hypothetical protein